MGTGRRMTRRQRALCWCLVMGLAAGCFGLQHRYLTYQKPVREAEEEAGIGKTERIMELTVEERYRPGRREIRGNEKAMMLLTIQNVGRTTRKSYLDCTGEALFYTAVYVNEPKGDADLSGGRGLEVFGRVNDPAGNKMQLKLFWTPEERGEEKLVKTVEIPQFEWVKKGDLVFFGKEFDLAEPGGGWGEMKAEFLLLDGEGRELACQEQAVSWHEIGFDAYF